MKKTIREIFDNASFTTSKIYYNIRGSYPTIDIYVNNKKIATRGWNEDDFPLKEDVEKKLNDFIKSYPRFFIDIYLNKENNVAEYIFRLEMLTIDKKIFAQKLLSSIEVQNIIYEKYPFLKNYEVNVFENLYKYINSDIKETLK